MKTALRWEEVLKRQLANDYKAIKKSLGHGRTQTCVFITYWRTCSSMDTHFSGDSGSHFLFSVPSHQPDPKSWTFYPQLYFPNVFPSHRHFQPLISYQPRTSAILSNLPVFYLLFLEIKILFVFWFLGLLELWGERTVFFVLNKKAGKQ